MEKNISKTEVKNPTADAAKTAPGQQQTPPRPGEQKVQQGQKPAPVREEHQQRAGSFAKDEPK